MDGLSSSIATASAMQQEMTAMAVQTTVLKKTLQVEKELGQALVDMIATAGATAGANMQSPGKAVGVGTKIDISG